MKKLKNAGISCSVLAATTIASSAHADVTATSSVNFAGPSPVWQKPTWLTDLSAGTKESYDNNVLLVSGNGMHPQWSLITGITPKIGFDFAPLLGDQQVLKAFTFAYAPDIEIYHYAPAESYDAQRFNNFLKLKAGDFSANLTNSFLYNNGSRTAPIYALNQLPALLGGNQNDKFRNFFAQAVPRERRDQFQDRANIALQYNVQNFFIRPTASLLYYNLETHFENATLAPNIGYQNWPDRYDVNGGADIGYRLTPNFAVLLGYRYGHQYQQQFPANISADRHFSTSDYQRALVGLEGNPWNWLNIKMSAGPDFRHYNSMAPVNDYHPLFAFAEASATATITKNQSLTFYTKEWEWVASTGLVPYYDSTYTLNYHWTASKHWGFDIGPKVFHATFSSGNDLAGSAPSLRDDIQCTACAMATYNFNANLSANVAYNYNLGRNLDNLPAASQPSYRNFEQDILSLGVQYKF